MGSQGTPLWRRALSGSLCSGLHCAEGTGCSSLASGWAGGSPGSGCVGTAAARAAQRCHGSWEWCTQRCWWPGTLRAPCQRDWPCWDSALGAVTQRRCPGTPPTPPLPIPWEQTPCPQHPRVLKAAVLGWMLLSQACPGPASQGAVAVPSCLGQGLCPPSHLPGAQPPLLTAASLAGSSRSQSVASSPYAPQPPAEPQLKKMEPPSEGKVSGGHRVVWGVRWPPS